MMRRVPRRIIIALIWDLNALIWGINAMVSHQGIHMMLAVLGLVNAIVHYRYYRMETSEGCVEY